ncbi:alkylated DNA repair protein (DNA oxidative demethylase) [Kitasatospora sp. MAA19]|uniref:alpha-ketoglutarate-dependent dioxygenase AlkB family protein n=1 Tax=Kitasatospora sp. MAA19 TaxID=3035090 RepID=UPI0024751434|nr:alpha-ketoglutarate-dependent dioxygenase AlkB [Kitasatospora sp. MAA19]MDH6710982.1 alkylated DNA repair protein (DNA oxidative demethylase) [Kitasatospora sp. MAA19]
MIQGELFGDLPGSPAARGRVEPAPGAVLLPGWLDAEAQLRLVAACREWARPPAGLHAVRMPTGGMMSVRMVSLGWHWYPYGYRSAAEDGTPVKPFPPELGRLARRAVADAYGADAREIAGAASYEPDIAIVNHYPHGAKMGLHQDRDERIDAPVVSLSLGDACVFRLGNTETRTRPWTDLELRSGDLLVFGGPARFAYHGVVRTVAGTADPGLGLVGRLNITVRQSGLVAGAAEA